MRVLRFSLKRLLILVALIGLLLYVLFLRPTVVAKQFAHKLETSADLESVSAEYFDGMDTNGASVHSVLQERTWADLFKCRQDFAISMERAFPNNSKQTLVAIHRYRATPLGVCEEDGSCLEVKEPRYSR